MSWTPARVVALSAVVAACAAAGPYDEPYALVESGSRSATRKELPAIIHSVDGLVTRDPRRTGAIRPGLHVLEIHLSTQEGPPSKYVRTIEIELLRCTRYRVVAHYSDLVHVEWVPVMYPEPIGECLARFP